MLVDVGKIRAGVLNMFKVNLGLRPGERILVLTDIPRPGDWAGMGLDKLFDMVKRAFLARAVAQIAREEFPNCQVEFYAYPATGMSGLEPPPGVGDRMKSADVVVAITTYSLSHTRAREEATRAGARVASMPGFLEEMFYPDGPMAADYRAIKELSEELAELLTRAEEARVITPAGTDMEFSLRGREGLADTGMLTERGSWGNLPAGEAFIAPVEGTARGRMVVQAGWHPGLEEDMTLVVRDGEVVEILGGGAVGDRLRDRLRPGVDEEPYRSRRNIAELGIGTNPFARRPDVVLEAEKIKGTVHIAVGSNKFIGGLVETDLHIDFVLPEPDLYVDGEAIIRHGEFLLG